MSDEESGFSGFDDDTDNGDGGDGGGGGLCGSCQALGLGLLLFPFCLLLLGWNEQSFVCDNSRILYAQTNAKEVGCSNAGIENEFVFFSCPLVPSTLETFSMCSFNTQNRMSCASQPPINFTAVSGRQKVEMVQCQESCQTHKRKNSFGQNVKEKVCQYSLTWTSDLIQSASFTSPIATVNQGCPGIQQAAGNPIAPTNVDMGISTLYSSDVRVGAPNSSFELNRDLIKGLYPTSAVNIAPFAPRFAAGQAAVSSNTQPWVRPLQISSANVMVQGKYLVTCASQMLGCVRVSFYESNTTSPSVITQVKSGGLTEKEEVPGSWGCAKAGWQAVIPEKQTKAGMIAELQSMNRLRVWLIRLVGLVLCWIAVYMCFQPIAAAAGMVGDCINMVPCGGYIDDFLVGLVDSVLCLLSCGIGCGSGLLVIALVWLYMRPLYGGLMVAGAVALCLCACCVRSQATKSRPPRKGGRKGGTAPVDPSVAQGFLEAARAEYVYGAPRAVESFFDGQGVAPEDQQALGPYEDQIREAYDKHKAITDLQRAWGLGAEE